MIKKIEETGIGRPSTYASLLEKIKEREYAEKRNVEGVCVEGKEYSLEEKKIVKTNIKKIIGEQKNKIIITNLGKEVLNFLSKHFNDIFGNYLKKYDFLSENQLKI